MLTSCARMSLSAVVFMWACGEAAMPTLAQDGRAVAPGTWGGQHIRLEVTTTAARVEYDCAHGTIIERMAIDRDGRFDVRGTHVRERPGPQREGDEARAQPARYTGLVKGSVMTLKVVLPETNETVGQFDLTKGSEGIVRKCL